MFLILFKFKFFILLCRQSYCNPILYLNERKRRKKKLFCLLNKFSQTLSLLENFKLWAYEMNFEFLTPQNFRLTASLGAFSFGFSIFNFLASLTQTTTLSSRRVHFAMKTKLCFYYKLTSVYIIAPHHHSHVRST